MFSYSPTTQDRSGEIMAAGQLQAAATNAESMVGLGENIGEALKSVGGSFAGAMQQNAMGDSAYEALGAIGQMYPGMKNAFTALGKMDPRTRRLASMSILDNLGAISQLGIAGMRDDAARESRALTARGQNITVNMPNMRAAADAQAKVAAGQGTMTMPSNINADVIP
jgi:hypothetical protein